MNPQSRFIDEHAAPSDSIVDGTMLAGFRYFQIRTAAIGYTFLPAPPYEDYLSPEQWERVARDIETRRPRFMILRDGQRKILGDLEPELRFRYTLIGQKSGRYARVGLYVLKQDEDGAHRR